MISVCLDELNHTPVCNLLLLDKPQILAATHKAEAMDMFNIFIW